MGILLGGGKSASLGNIGAVIMEITVRGDGNFPSPSRLEERSEVLVQGENINKVLSPAFVGSNRLIFG